MEDSKQAIPSEEGEPEQTYSQSSSSSSSYYGSARDWAAGVWKDNVVPAALYYAGSLLPSLTTLEKEDAEALINEDGVVTIPECTHEPHITHSKNLFP